MRNESCSEMPLLIWYFHLIKSVNGKFNVGWNFGGTVPVTSSFSTSSLCLSTSRPSKMCSLVLARSLRAVAMTGRSVVLSRRLASWRPMPRDAGDTRSQGFDMAAGERFNEGRGDYRTQATDWRMDLCQH